MTVRKCGTCKHYEPAPFWRQGWCRNPLLYSPQQSHLVDEDDLDCDRGMGNHWEAIPAQEFAPSSTAGSFGYVPQRRDTSDRPASAGDTMQAVRFEGRGGRGGTTKRGGDVSQFGGPGRPGSGGYGGDSGGYGGDGGDDDRDFPPFGDQGDEGSRFPTGRQFDYQVEERYWTDYLRIALPVLGVIILLGLVWFWVASLLGDPEEQDNDVTPDVSGPVIVDDTPTPEDQNGDDAQEPPLAVTTPTPEPNEGNEEPAPAAIGPGSTVVVANTGGAGLNMRVAPSTTAEVQEELDEGASLTVTGESVEAEGYVWWPVESATSTGFVVENFIQASN